jgi:hypothetical protein
MPADADRGKILSLQYSTAIQRTPVFAIACNYLMCDPKVLDNDEQFDFSLELGRSTFDLIGCSLLSAHMVTCVICL